MAGRATLAYLGADDVMLVGNPEMTYFIERYSTSIPFAKRLEVISFDSQVRFGQETSVDLQKRGDLMSALYLRFNTPPIPSVCDSAMNYMIEYVELYCNSQLVERLYGEYIEMMNDIRVPAGKQSTLQNLTAKVYPLTSTGLNTTYNIPLPFTCLEKGFDIEKNVINFKISLKNSSQFSLPVFVYTDALDMSLLVEYIYLEKPLKRDTQIFEQVQRVEFLATQGTNYVRCKLGLMNLVKEIFIVIQNVNSFGFDYTTDGSYNSASQTWVNGTTEQLSSLVLKLNGVERIAREIGTPLFLRVIQPMEFHTRVPDRKFYMYSFSIDPDGDVPTGQINMSRIFNQILELNMNPSAQARFIRIYAVNYNFIKDGRVLFSNNEEAGVIGNGIAA
jgi:hypothetical protein